MATNDFVHDVVKKLEQDNVEYMVVSLQKGKESSKADAFYYIRTKEGANMLLTTVNEIFCDPVVEQLLDSTELLSYSEESPEDNEIEIDPDNPFWTDNDD